MLNKKSTSVAQELYARNAELLEFNRILSLIQDIESIVLIKQKSIDSLISNIIEKIVTEAELSLFGILVFEKKELIHKGLGVLNSESLSYENISPSFVSGLEADISSNFSGGISDDVTYQSDEIFNFVRENLTLHFKNVDLGSNMNATMLYAERNNQFTSFQKHLIQRLGDFIGTILENVILTERLSMATIRLTKSNDKLKALDEAKDEFVSMASHQLRTPLTSIKGYISMVVDGDAGEINDVQKKMLGQALFSSQRMVYLISDLLNVSRLRTGKFAIEAKSIYLPDLVESEMGQLIEGAKSKNITLSFEKPSEFPILNLDDMKLRQVVMNFTDNAIYYTPSGGKITVSLKDKKDSVEFTVKDTGIGVPKDEQHKLFAKFYRAENARKARPDGTGLGLFMAQKVIVAQGGAIIFDSKEGKGSTFGFSFPKAKLEIKKDSSEQEQKA